LRGQIYFIDTNLVGEVVVDDDTHEGSDGDSGGASQIADTTRGTSHGGTEELLGLLEL
jgi:hypothetical protein